MAFTASVFAITTRGIVPGAQIINTTHWFSELAIDLTIANSVIDAMLEQYRQRWITGIVSQLSVQYVFQDITLKEITGWVMSPAGNKIPRYDYTALSAAGLGTVGGTIGDALPYQNALQVFLATPLGTKRGRGRLKLGPYAESQQANSLFDSVFLTTVNTNINTLFGNITAGASSTVFQPVVLSLTNLYLGPTLGPARDAARVITAKVPRQIVACQRSRKPRSPI